MATPVGELAAAGFPEGAPAARMNFVAVRNLLFERAVPEIPVEGIWRSFAGGVFSPGMSEVVAALDAAGPDEGFDGFAELVFAEDFDGLHALEIAGALVAHLGDEIRAGIQAFLDEAEFVELLDEGFLAVDVFVVLHRHEHHGRMMEIGGIDDDGVEIVGAFGEGFAVIEFFPGAGVFGGDFVHRGGVDIAEADKLAFVVAFECAALHAADGALDAGADLEDAEFAVLIGLRAGRRGESRNACGEDGSVPKEGASGDR